MNSIIEILAIPSFALCAYFGFLIGKSEDYRTDRLLCGLALIFIIGYLYFPLFNSEYRLITVYRNEDIIRSFIAWCSLGLILGALFALNRRTYKKYYIAIRAREGLFLGGKTYNQGDVLYVKYFYTERACNKFCKHGGDIQVYSSEKCYKFIGYIDHLIKNDNSMNSDDIENSIYCLPSYVPENRSMTELVKPEYVKELKEYLNISDEEKTQIDNFFYNPVLWDETKKRN